MPDIEIKPLNLVHRGKGENIVKCDICGRSFNNFKKRGLYLLACSRKCRDELRRRRGNELRKKRQRQRKKEHRCIACGKKVKPTIIYHQYCKEHKKKYG